jgi:hypothetical protein
MNSHHKDQELVFINLVLALMLLFAFKNEEFVLVLFNYYFLFARRLKLCLAMRILLHKRTSLKPQVLSKSSEKFQYYFKSVVLMQRITIKRVSDYEYVNEMLTCIIFFLFFFYSTGA